MGTAQVFEVYYNSTKASYPPGCEGLLQGFSGIRVYTSTNG